MIYAVLKIDDPDSIDIVEFQAIDRVNNTYRLTRKSFE